MIQSIGFIDFGAQKLEKINLVNLEGWKNRQLTDIEVAAIYGVSRATIWRWVQSGRLPSPTKHGGNTTRWGGGDIAAAMAQASTITDADRQKASNLAKKRSKAA